MNRRHLSVVLALAVTALFFGLALRNVSLREVGAVVAGARWGWMLVMAALIPLDLFIRSLRWRRLLAKSARAPVFVLFRLEAIGIAVNNVLFMRLGELARAFLAGRELGLPVATALASIAVERALDLATLLGLFCLAALLAPALVPLAVIRGAIGVLAAVLMALGLLAAAEGPLEPGGAWERRLRAWPRIHDVIEQLAAGALALRDLQAAVAVAALSLSLWMVDALYYWAAARALDLGGLIDCPRSILVLSWAGAGSALPAAPGAFGTIEALIKSILIALGASPSRALGYALFCHALGYVVVTGIGLVFLYQVGLTLAELKGALARPAGRPNGA